MQKLTNEECLKRFVKAHGNHYDYSKVKYESQSKKVCIICPEHGEFWQSPVDHWEGKGCPKCAKESAGKHSIKGNKEEFIKKARKVHGNKYDYSKVEYKGLCKKVCIICPEHGEFWQSPVNHLSGRGCSKCNKYKNYFDTTEEFIKKAREVHGDKYDYSKVKYVNHTTKVCIICPEHGEFWTTIHRHLNGAICNKCARELNGKKKIKSNKEEFIKKAREVHGDKYDYSKVEYVDSLHKVCIICPEHGEFWQVPRYHILRGCGCPNCNGVHKSYKFNLLKEFESEYAFRAFLQTNHINILLMILSNLCENNPKYKPIEKDIEKALKNTPSKNPIKYLEEKYSSIAEIEEPEIKESIDIDFDDDNALDAIVKTSDETEQEKEATLADLIKNEKKVAKTLKKIEHMLTPELRDQIMNKYENDKLRIRFANMEK